MFGYALSKAAQSIALKITSPVYFHEFGYIGKDSILSQFNLLSSERLGKQYIFNLTIYFSVNRINMIKSRSESW